MKRFLLHLCAKAPAKTKTISRKKARAVSSPPPSDSDVENVCDISGRQIGVIMVVIAKKMNPPKEANKSFFILFLKFIVFKMDQILHAKKITPRMHEFHYLFIKNSCSRGNLYLIKTVTLRMVLNIQFNQ